MRKTWIFFSISVIAFFSVYIFLITYIHRKNRKPLEKKYQEIITEKKYEFQVLRDYTSQKFPTELEQNTTAIIKTLFRPSCLMRLIKSIRKYYENLPIIIIDDSTEPLSENFSSPFLTYTHIDFDSGVSKGRNIGVNLVKTKYVLILDDDFVFNDSTDISRMYDFLEENPKYNIICGAVSDRGLYTGKYIQTMNGVEIEEIPNNPKGKNIITNTDISIQPEIFESERGLNFFLARKNLLEKIPWDDELKTEEHMEHFYRMYLAGEKVAIHPSVEAFHDGGSGCSDNFIYKDFRSRNFFNIIFNKYNIRNFCGNNITKKQQKFNKVLTDFSSIFPSAFEVSLGTALGFHRERGFIEHDEDIDIFVRKENMPNLDIIREKVEKYFSIPKTFGEPSDGFEISLVHNSTGIKLDIFVIYTEKNYMWYSSYTGKNYTEQLIWKLPLYKPETITIFGNTYNIMPKNILMYVYGPNWNIPKNYTYGEYVKEPSGCLWKDDSPLPTMSNNFINDFFRGNVWVINLESRQDKMDETNSQLKRLGINYQRFEALKGTTGCKNLTAGEMGCKKSHMSLWKKLSESNSEWMLIFEDDIFIPKNITQEILGYAMLEAMYGKRDPEIVYFGSCFTNVKNLPNISFQRKIPIMIGCGTALCTHAYAISRKFAQRMLSQFSSLIMCEVPVDNLIKNVYKNYPEKSMVIFTDNVENNPDYYGFGLILQKRATKSDVSDRTNDKTGGRVSEK